VARIFPLVIVQTRVIEAIIVCYVGLLSSRFQIIGMMIVESILLVIFLSLDVLSDNSVKRLNMLQQVVMIFILGCIGIIGENKDAALNIQIAWGIEIVIILMLLIMFVMNMKRLLVRSSLNIRLQVDKMINQWKDAFNATEAEGFKSSENKKNKSESKLADTSQIHFKISEEEEEAT